MCTSDLPYLSEGHSSTSRWCCRIPGDYTNVAFSVVYIVAVTASLCWPTLQIVIAFSVVDIVTASVWLS